jgi:hypothetical protein
MVTSWGYQEIDVSRVDLVPVFVLAIRHFSEEKKIRIGYSNFFMMALSVKAQQRDSAWNACHG